jgi:hypothetical protein
MTAAMMTGTQLLRNRALFCIGALATQTLACAGEAGEDTAQAETTELVVAVTTADLVGSYDPTNAWLRNPVISDWGGSPLLKTSYEYGPQVYPVDYVLQPVAGEIAQFTSDSSFTIYYGPTRCTYPVQIQINVTRDTSGGVNLYVRDNVPTRIPAGLPAGAPCPQLQNSWRVHQRPYVKRGPSQVFAAMMDGLCGDISARVGAVESGKRLAAGPIGELPANIYAATGSWQSLSTPGRDASLRESFRGVHHYIRDNATGADPASHDRAVLFREIWDQHQRTCRFEYKTSNGAPVPFTLNDVQERLFDLSFDPYHCTEMRWGAFPNHVGENASCNTQSETHVKRFNDEKSMRNIIDRPPPGTLTPIGYGPAEHEDVDVPALLRRLTGG